MECRISVETAGGSHPFASPFAARQFAETLACEFVIWFEGHRVAIGAPGDVTWSSDVNWLYGSPDPFVTYGALSIDDERFIVVDYDNSQGDAPSGCSMLLSCAGTAWAGA